MSENFTESLSFMELNKNYIFLEEKLNQIIKRLDNFYERSLDVNEFYEDETAKEYIEKIRIYKSFLKDDCLNFFKYNMKYISYQIAGRTFEDYLFDLQSSIQKNEESINKIGLLSVLSVLIDTIQTYNTIFDISEKERQANLLIKDLKGQVAKATESVKSVISAKEALESKPTEDIYSNAAKKYIKTARFYDVLLLVTLGIFYYITSNFFENFQMISIFQAIKKSSSEAQTLAIFFFITKLTIVSIVITLATIFIRRSSHFRKLHDQANQTSLELNALPNYLRQVDSEHHSEIYKEMIPKFFGKELDQSQNDKVGDLVKDQLAAGTELIKASAEMVKNAKSLGDSAVKTKNAKSHSTSTEDKSKSDDEV